jgi:cell division protein FtsB
MPKAKEKKSHVISTTLFVLLFAYFCYHAISGDRGLLALIQFNKRVDSLRAEADSVRAKRLQLEHRVSLLKPDSLDLDMLDEQARKLLGYAGKDETVYEFPEDKGDDNSDSNSK